MEQGKKICESLKAIRSDIAEANGIDYKPAECHHEGDCAGTCPKCESETRWLERQLRLRRRLGKAVVIAGMAVSLGSLSSCNVFGGGQLQGDVPNDNDSLYMETDNRIPEGYVPNDADGEEMPDSCAVTKQDQATNKEHSSAPQGQNEGEKKTK